jgi:hypothetical protein
MALNPVTWSAALGLYNIPTILPLTNDKTIMHMRHALLISIFISFALLAGCSSKIDGEVFIVTKGGQSVKLGLIDVYAVPVGDLPEKYTKYIKKQDAYIKDAYSKINTSTYDPAYAKYREQVKGLIPVVKVFSEQVKALENNRFRSAETIRGAYHKQREIEQKYNSLPVVQACEASIEAVKSSMQMIKDQQSRIEDSVRKEFGNKTFIDFIQSAATLDGARKVTTNSDGKFVISVPSSSGYYIFARASREALNESYTWLLPVTESKDGRLTLSNNNLLDSDSFTNTANSGFTKVQADLIKSSISAKYGYRHAMMLFFGHCCDYDSGECDNYAIQGMHEHPKSILEKSLLCK